MCAARGGSVPLLGGDPARAALRRRLRARLAGVRLLRRIRTGDARQGLEQQHRDAGLALALVARLLQALGGFLLELVAAVERGLEQSAQLGPGLPVEHQLLEREVHVLVLEAAAVRWCGVIRVIPRRWWI